MHMFNEQEFYYTLEPPPLGADPVDRFLVRYTAAASANTTRLRSR